MRTVDPFCVHQLEEDPMRRDHNDCPTGTHGTLDDRAMGDGHATIAQHGGTDAWIDSTHPDVAGDHLRPDQIPGY